MVCQHWLRCHCLSCAFCLLEPDEHFRQDNRQPVKRCYRNTTKSTKWENAPMCHECLHRGTRVACEFCENDTGSSSSKTSNTESLEDKVKELEDRINKLEALEKKGSNKMWSPDDHNSFSGGFGDICWESVAVKKTVECTLSAGWMWVTERRVVKLWISCTWWGGKYTQPLTTIK